MSFPSYPEYRNSGCQWLSEIPSHWSLPKVKQKLRLLSQKSDKKIKPVGLENIQSWTGNFIASDTQFEGDGIDFDLGDILFGKLRPYLAKVYLAAFKGEAVGDFFVLRASQSVYPRFAQYLMLNQSFIDIVDGSTYGSKMPRVNWDYFGNMLIPMPLREEQKIIADFLDQETTKIDALIAEQEKLIALLKEKRQAVISHAVTKGLDPNVKMKDSRVDWLGQVPEHWKIGSLSNFAKVDSGTTPNRENQLFWDGDIPWIKTGEINYEPITDAEEFISECALMNSSVRIAPKGTLLMAMYGQGITRGRVAILEIPATYNQACAAIQFCEQALTNFMYFYFIAAYLHIRDSGNETSQMNLSVGGILKFKIVVPPLNEQLEIIEHLKVLTKRIDLLLLESNSVINILKERRSALISAAVTGQIDVRNVAITKEAA